MAGKDIHGSMGNWFLRHTGNIHHKQPVETADVKVITKRILVTGEHSHTTYFVTFENASSSRQEFQVDGELYGLLVEGDNGKLTYQGYKVIDFNRY